MAKNHLASHLEESSNLKPFQQERLLVEVAYLMHQAMQERGITRKQLADAIGVSKGRITHYLGGQCNLTLRTIADVFTTLGCTFRPTVESIESDGWEQIPDFPNVFTTPASKHRALWEVKDGGDNYFAHFAH